MSEVAGDGAVVLTADLIARAIIAAARSYGDDPVRACTVKRGITRRAMTPAAVGVSTATGAPLKRVLAIMGLRTDKGLGRQLRTPGYAPARAAAEQAVCDALAEVKPLVIGVDWATGPDSMVIAEGTDVLKIWCEGELVYDRDAPPQGDDTVEAGGCAPPILVERSLHAPPEFDEAQLPDPPLTPPEPVPAPEIAPAYVPPARQVAERRASVAELRAAAAPTVRDRILDTLADGSACPMGLATLLDVKELTIDRTLAELAHEGLVVADPMPVEGRRQQRWRLAA